MNAIFQKTPSEALHSEIERNSVIAKLSQKLLQSRDVEEISFLLLKSARQLTNSTNGFIAYLDPKTGRLTCPPLSGQSRDDCNTDNSRILHLLGLMSPDQKPVLVNNPKLSAIRLPRDHCAVHRYISVPAMVNNQLVGQVVISNAPRDYTWGDLEVVQQLADLYAIAMQRKQAEIALHENEKYHNLILNRISDVFVLCEVSAFGLKVVKTNNIALKLIKLREEDVIGKLIKDVLPPEMAETWLANSRKVIESGKPRVYEASNKFGIFEVTSIPVFNELGNCNHLIVTAREISERKKMEEHLLKMEKLESVGLLAGGIAHDFNNILTAIIGNTSLAKLKIGNTCDEKVTQLLTEIERACIGAKDLTQQLLTFAKGGTPVLASVSIGELLQEAATFSLSGSNVRCDFDIPADLWPAEIDQGQINQVINNLVINAVHAMQGGGILEIRARNVSVYNDNFLPLEEGKYVKISVHDHGEGIPPQHLDKLFDPYFTTKKMGSGLGLTTSYSIIRKHNGYITVDSEPGTGTTFFVYLPASVQEPESSAKPMVQASKHGKLLIMDDEKMIRFVLSEMLNHLGYEAACARDGDEAIQMYKEAARSCKPFDGVIMDLTIPGGMGGKEAIRKLGEIDPAVKAIVSSGYSNDPVMSNYQEYGFCSVVTKPYSIEQLAAALDSIFASGETATAG